MPLGQKRRQRLSKTDLLMGQSFQIGIGSKWSDSRICSIPCAMYAVLCCLHWLYYFWLLSWIFGFGGAFINLACSGSRSSSRPLKGMLLWWWLGEEAGTAFFFRKLLGYWLLVWLGLAASRADVVGRESQIAVAEKKNQIAGGGNPMLGECPTPWI